MNHYIHETTIKKCVTMLSALKRTLLEDHLWQYYEEVYAQTLKEKIEPTVRT